MDCSSQPRPGPARAVAALVAAAALFPSCGVRQQALAPPAQTAGGNWPSFRGTHARGVADGQDLPESWNSATGENVRWAVAIPGLAHSSPIVWGDRLFLTTAISSLGQATFRPGLYGDGTASEDRSEHRWEVLAVDKRTGRILWQRTAHTGMPQDKRHIKATYANSTPATDGRYVVALFGSEGLFAYDMEGNLIWRKELGRLNAGAYDAPDYEWGTASSPIIHEDLVIVQCDTQRDSFVLAADIRTGETVWTAARDEGPSWGTPTIFLGASGDELVTNGSNFIRGYDPRTGRELWRLGGSSKITAPTPVFAGDLIVVASGRAPERPIFAVRHGASGEITLAEDETSHASVAWSWTGRGPYMPTPLIYGDYVYVLGNSGVFDCYDLATGREVYRERLASVGQDFVRGPTAGSGFSASPVAADGRIYLSSEDGDVFVVRSGPEFALLGSFPLAEPLMATPAISDGVLYVRGRDHLYAIGK